MSNLVLYSYYICYVSVQNTHISSNCIFTEKAKKKDKYKRMKQQEIKEMKKKGGKGKVAPFTGTLKIFKHLLYILNIFLTIFYLQEMQTLI